MIVNIFNYEILISEDLNEGYDLSYKIDQNLLSEFVFKDLIKGEKDFVFLFKNEEYIKGDLIMNSQDDPINQKL